MPCAVVVKADNDDDDATDVRIETLAYSISGCLLSPPLLVSKEIAATDTSYGAMRN